MVMGHNIHRPKIRIPRLNMNDLNLLMQNNGQVATLQNNARLATLPEPVRQENLDVPMEADVQNGQAEVHSTFDNIIRAYEGGGVTKLTTAPGPGSLAYPLSRRDMIRIK